MSGRHGLATEIAAEAAGRVRFGIGHCYESGRDVPYMPWVEMIEAAMRETDTFNSIREYVTRASRTQPRLYVVETSTGPTNQRSCSSSISPNGSPKFPA